MEDVGLPATLALRANLIFAGEQLLERRLEVHLSGDLAADVADHVAGTE